MGELTIVTGVPNSGKSEWLDALLVNLSAAHGWSFALCSMEKRPKDHARQLLEKALGKPFFTLPYAGGQVGRWLGTLAAGLPGLAGGGREGGVGWGVGGRVQIAAWAGRCRGGRGGGLVCLGAQAARVRRQLPRTHRLGACCPALSLPSLPLQPSPPPLLSQPLQRPPPPPRPNRPPAGAHERRGAGGRHALGERALLPHPERV
jgi:hypothetical protein